jgi:hypothetical protein
MKLISTELKEDLDEAQEVLEKAGYVRIGKSGSCYGRVFHKKRHRYVLKLFKKNDEAYKKFVQYCIKNKTNPHLPKFSTKVLEVPNTVYNAVRVELLIECYAEHHLVSDYIRHYCCLHGDMTKIKKNSSPEFFNTFFQWHNDNSDIIKTCDEFIENFTNDDVSRLDMHAGNFMLRKTISGTTMVFTDPVAPK